MKSTTIVISLLLLIGALTIGCNGGKQTPEEPATSVSATQKSVVAVETPSDPLKENPDTIEELEQLKKKAQEDVMRAWTEQHADQLSESSGSANRLPNEEFYTKYGPMIELNARRVVLARFKQAGGVLILDDSGNVTDIDLANARVSVDDATVAKLLLFPGLKKLRLAAGDVSDETLDTLSNLCNLEELFLQDVPMSDEQLANWLANLPKLRRLTLRRMNKITDASIQVIAERPELDVLALIEMSELSATGLSPLKDSTKLRSLDLRNCGQMTSDDYATLIRFEQISELKLGGPAVNDQVIASIVEMPRLTSLTLEDAEITGEGLQLLAKSTELAGRLKTLAFARCYGVTDESLGILVHFPKLETLSLRDIMVTGSFIGELTKPLPVKSLIITNAFVDDGVIKQLPQKMPHLELLDLRGCNDVTAGAIEQMKKNMPDFQRFITE